MRRLAAEVTVEVIDLLGRQVMRYTPGSESAGANHTVDLNASTLPSGIYLYRVIAQTVTERLMQTGRMTLVK